MTSFWFSVTKPEEIGIRCMFSDGCWIDVRPTGLGYCTTLGTAYGGCGTCWPAVEEARA
jgi:hypothetical protein